MLDHPKAPGRVLNLRQDGAGRAKTQASHGNCRLRIGDWPLKTWDVKGFSWDFHGFFTPKWGKDGDVPLCNMKCWWDPSQATGRWRPWLRRRAVPRSAGPWPFHGEKNDDQRWVWIVWMGNSRGYIMDDDVFLLMILGIWILGDMNVNGIILGEVLNGWWSF